MPTIPVGFVRGRFVSADGSAIAGELLFEPQRAQTLGDPPVNVVRRIARVALVDGELEPLKLVTGAYRVRFRLVGVGLGPVELELTTEHTETDALDLSRVI